MNAITDITWEHLTLVPLLPPPSFLDVPKSGKKEKKIHTHTHTHTYIYQGLRMYVIQGKFLVSLLGLWIRFLCFLSHPLHACSLVTLSGLSFFSTSFASMTLLLVIFGTSKFLNSYSLRPVFFKPFCLSRRTLSSYESLFGTPKSNKR